jgi:hypothetical protein
LFNTDGRTDITKLIVAFYNFAKASIKTFYRFPGIEAVTKMDLIEKSWKCVDWMTLAQDRNKCCTLVNTMSIFRIL